MTVPTAAARPATCTDDAISRLESQVARVVKGKPKVIREAVVCILARGHMLIEDVPGVGKTTLARTLARSLGVEFQRIQFTSDLLPSDIIGVTVFRQAEQTFEFVPGPIFANVVLADEINRASPKTQSALLEAMSERQVTVDRVRHPLPTPFTVMATQNPLEHVGTFPLPESQLDRFLMSLKLGYPPRDEERSLLLSGGVQNLLSGIGAAVTADEIRDLQQSAGEIKVTEKLADYVLALADATRSSQQLLLGISTRGVQGLLAATKALALCEGRDFAVPDDVQRLAPAVLSHRIALKVGSSSLAVRREAIRKIVHETPVPA